MADGNNGPRYLFRCTRCGATRTRHYSARVCLRRSCRGKLERVTKEADKHA